MNPRRMKAFGQRLECIGPEELQPTRHTVDLRKSAEPIGICYRDKFRRWSRRRGLRLIGCGGHGPVVARLFCAAPVLFDQFVRP